MTTQQIGFRLFLEGQQQVINGVRGVGDELQRMSGSVRNAAALGVGLAVIVPTLRDVARGYADTADSVTVLRNQLQLATGSSESAAQAYERLFTIAQRSRTSFTELGNSFAAISRAGATLGLSQERLLTVTEAIGNAMTISGGSAAGMEAALVQLAQGLSAGVLRGDELNSVMEQSPRLARALAEGLGVSTGELRKLGEAGALTAQKIIGALETSAPQLIKEVQGATLTVGQAFTVLSNSTTKFIGDLDRATGASTAAANAIRALSGVVDTLGSTINQHQTAFAILGGLLGGVAAAGSVAAVGYGVLKIAGAVGTLGAALAANPAVLALLGIGAVAGVGAAVVSAANRTSAGIEDAIRTLEEANRRSEAALARAEARGSTKAADNIRATMDARLKQIRALRGEQALLDAPVDNTAEETRIQRQTAQYAEQQAAIKGLTDLKLQLAGVDSSYTGKVEALINARQLGLVSDKEYDTMLGQLQKQVHKLSDEEKDAAALSQARADAAASAARDWEQSQAAGIARANDLLEAAHAAGIVSDREYYATRRALVEQDTATRVQALERERAAVASARLASSDDAELQRQRIAQRQKLASLDAQIATARADGAKGVTVLGMQEGTADKRRLSSLQALRDTQEDYLRTLQEGQRIELSTAGVGTAERQRMQGEQQIRERYAQQRLQLDAARRQAELEGRFDATAEDRYKAELGVINDFQQKALQSYAGYYKRRREQESSWQLGAAEALNNYLANSRDVASQSAQLFTTAFQGIEDALVSFVTKGKLSFASLRDAVIADIARMQLRSLMAGLTGNLLGSGIGSMLGSVMGTGGTAAVASAMKGDSLDNFLALNGDFASVLPNAKGNAFGPGGRVSFFAKGDVFGSPTLFGYGAGRLGILGEAGEEAVMPLTRGRDGKLGVAAQGAGGAPQIVMHNSYSFATGVSPGDMVAFINRRDEALKAQILQSRRRGGVFAD